MELQTEPMQYLELKHKKKGTGPVAVQKRSHRFGNGRNGTQRIALMIWGWGISLSKIMAYHIISQRNPGERTNHGDSEASY